MKLTDLDQKKLNQISSLLVPQSCTIPSAALKNYFKNQLQSDLEFLCEKDPKSEMYIVCLKIGNFVLMEAIVTRMK